MTQLEIYETCGAVAAALPDAEREMFAELVKRLSGASPPLVVSLPGRPTGGQSGSARRWLRDAGWLRR